MQHLCWINIQRPTLLPRLPPKKGPKKKEEEGEREKNKQKWHELKDKRGKGAAMCSVDDSPPS